MNTQTQPNYQGFVYLHRGYFYTWEGYLNMVRQRIQQRARQEKAA